MDIKPDTFPKYTPNPLLAGLPQDVKDPANYNKIQKALLETLANGHSHSEMEDWGKCGDCQFRIQKHKELMQKLGFKTPAHYFAWKKVNEIILKRIPLR